MLTRETTLYDAYNAMSTYLNILSLLPQLYMMHITQCHGAMYHEKFKKTCGLCDVGFMVEMQLKNHVEKLFL